MGRAWAHYYGHGVWVPNQVSLENWVKTLLGLIPMVGVLSVALIVLLWRGSMLGRRNYTSKLRYVCVCVSVTLLFITIYSTIAPSVRCEFPYRSRFCTFLIRSCLTHFHSLEIRPYVGHLVELCCYKITSRMQIIVPNLL